MKLNLKCIKNFDTVHTVDRSDSEHMNWDTNVKHNRSDQSLTYVTVQFSDIVSDQNLGNVKVRERGKFFVAVIAAW